jgi:8-oxo-(d)GTP phosphatase
MLFFINDTPLKIIDKIEKIEKKRFDITIVDQQFFFEDTLKGKILLKNPSIKQVLTLVNYLQRIKNENILQITVFATDKKQYSEAIKASFKKIDAGGGLVLKNEKYLMIHRLGLWDLPKGKLDEGETIEQCAVREVEEECQIKATLLEKITDTWHSYTTRGGNDMLKKTSWYLMACADDSQMKPQTEESIDEIRWMTKEEVTVALTESYKSIEHVFRKYEKQKEVK